MKKSIRVPVYATPDAAESAFYEAFEQGDLEAMMAVWMDDQIICIHPMGTLLSGPQAIRSSWQQLFTNFKPMHFQNQIQHQSNSSNLSVCVVIENIYLQGDSTPRPPILATNVYRKTDSGWRMCVHHASPAVIKPGASDTVSIPDIALH